MTDPLRPMPMSQEEIADLVERTRAAMSEAARKVVDRRCWKRARAARMRRWRYKRVTKA